MLSPVRDGLQMVTNPLEVPSAELIVGPMLPGRLWGPLDSADPNPDFLTLLLACGVVLFALVFLPPSTLTPGWGAARSGSVGLL